MAVTASVAASASSVQLFAAPSTQQPGWIPATVNGRTVFNDSAAVLYLKFGVTASATDYTVQIPAGGYYEFPWPVYAGEVDGIWASANGNARLTSW